MSKSYKIMFGIFIAFLAGLVILESLEKEPVNWFESYINQDKIPFGSYVLFESLSQNKSTDITLVDVPPYEFLQDTVHQGTYFFLNNNVYFDKDELNTILNWVSKGNNVFLSANSISKPTKDSLGLQTETLLSTKDMRQRPLLNLSNPKFKQDSAYDFGRTSYVSYFNEIDTLKTTILGYADYLNENRAIKENYVNFIKLPYGKGSLTLHLFPKAFTNYFMLMEDNISYTEHALAYLNTNDKIYWDRHYKSGQTFQTSLMYVLFSNKYFKWSYYLLLITGVLFVIFEGKRKQRAIKVITPLSNKTYDYTKTIAGLYLDKKDHKSIINKQISLFMEFIRNELRLQTTTLNDNFYRQVSARSNNTFEDTKALFKFLKQMEATKHPKKEDVLNVNLHIQKFKLK